MSEQSDSVADSEKAKPKKIEVAEDGRILTESLKNLYLKRRDNKQGHAFDFITGDWRNNLPFEISLQHDLNLTNDLLLRIAQFKKTAYVRRSLLPKTKEEALEKLEADPYVILEWVHAVETMVYIAPDGSYFYFGDAFATYFDSPEPEIEWDIKSENEGNTWFIAKGKASVKDGKLVRMKLDDFHNHWG